MLPIAKRIVEDAKKKAEEIVREAMELKKIMLKEAEEEKEEIIKERVEDVRKEVEMEARAEKARMIMKARREVMKKEREVFERAVERAKEILRSNPERFFRLCIERAGFENPEVVIGRRYVEIARKMGIEGKIEDIDGIRIGKNGVWVNGEIGDNVDEVAEKRIKEIVEMRFGEGG